jgi:hypothetical protein
MIQPIAPSIPSFLYRLFLTEMTVRMTRECFPSSSSSPQVMPACGLISILKKRSVCVSECPEPVKAAAKRRVRFKVADDGYDQGKPSQIKKHAMFFSLQCFK